MRRFQCWEYDGDGWPEEVTVDLATCVISDMHGVNIYPRLAATAVNLHYNYFNDRFDVTKYEAKGKLAVGAEYSKAIVFNCLKGVNCA
jgi:hypothetical protein